MTHPPLLQAPPKPTSDAAAASASVTVREDTPWPSTGKMSGNLFEDRNWLLPKGYLAMEGRKEEVTRPYLKEEGKAGKQNPNQKEEKCSWGPDCPFCKAQKKRLIFPINMNKWKASNRNSYPNCKQKGLML